VDWAQLISNVGVPATIAFYVLYRLDASINALSRNVRALAILLAQQQGTTLEKVEHRYGINGKGA